MSKSNVFTKCFGNISIDIDDDGHGDIFASYNDQEINIFLCNYNVYREKAKTCLMIIDKYKEINDIAKKTIMDNFIKNETVKYYFEHNFKILEEEQLMEIFGVNNFRDIEIKNIVDKLKYPNLIFVIENNEITISVDYKISKEYSNEILCVKMDERLNVINITHEI